jgi:excisionase family DNA binding protein
MDKGKQSKQSGRFMRYPEMSHFTGLPLGTLYSMVSNQLIPHVRLGGRLVLFDRVEIEAWLDEQRVPVDPGLRERKRLKRAQGNRTEPPEPMEEVDAWLDQHNDPHRIPVQE